MKTKIITLCVCSLLLLFALTNPNEDYIKNHPKEFGTDEWVRTNRILYSVYARSHEWNGKVRVEKCYGVLDNYYTIHKIEVK